MPTVLFFQLCSFCPGVSFRSKRGGNFANGFIFQWRSFFLEVLFHPILPFSQSFIFTKFFFNGAHFAMWSHCVRAFILLRVFILVLILPMVFTSPIESNFHFASGFHFPGRGQFFQGFVYSHWFLFSDGVHFAMWYHCVGTFILLRVFI